MLIKSAFVLTAFVATIVAGVTSASAFPIASGTTVFSRGSNGPGCNLNGQHYATDQAIQVVEQDPSGRTHTIWITCTASGWVKN
jgi:siroheme synthase